LSSKGRIPSALRKEKGKSSLVVGKAWLRARRFDEETRKKKKNNTKKKKKGYQIPRGGKAPGTRQNGPGPQVEGRCDPGNEKEKLKELCHPKKIPKQGMGLQRGNRS